jgi:hypothetical protein
MTDSAHNWYAIKFPQDRFPFATPQPLVNHAKELWEKNSFPKDFCVFQEIDESYDTIIYFSPTAWQYCSEEVEQGYDGDPCDRPVRHKKPVVCVVGLCFHCESQLEL